MGLTRWAFIAAGLASVGLAVRRYNPLLFDLALKRQLRWEGQGFLPCVFETRRVFAGA